MKRILRIRLFQFREDSHSIAIERASFLRSSGLREDQLLTVDAIREVPSVDHLRDVTAIIFGGSPLSVWDAPHRDELRECLKIARLSGLAMLGVCFGAQLMADMWGGEVSYSPTMQEFGSYEIELTKRGMREGLFDGLPQTFFAQCSHHDRITTLPPGAIRLAFSSVCSEQAFGFPGFGIYGVQFHPERSKEDFEKLFSHKGFDPNGCVPNVDDVVASLRETPEASRIVSNFVQHYARFCRTLL